MPGTPGQGENRSEEATMFAGFGRRNRRGLPLIAVIAASACSTTGGPPGEQGERTEVVIVVRNDNFNQATVYLSPDYGARRLGIVRGKSEARFKLDWYMPEIQLRIRFLAGGEVLSQPWTVGSGEVWTFIIPASCC